MREWANQLVNALMRQWVNDGERMPVVIQTLPHLRIPELIGPFTHCLIASLPRARE
jgi:hypothetical protein